MIKKYSEITGKNLNFELKYEKVRKGDVKRHLADISHAKKVLGYNPTITLKEGIGRYINWRLKSSKQH